MSTDVKSFSCSLCSYVSSRKYNLERHISLVHEQQKQDVSFRAINVENVAYFDENVASETQNVAYVDANVAPITQDVQTSVQQTPENTWKCTTCYKEFRTERHAFAHVPKCKKIQSPLECNLCHETFLKRYSLARHKKQCTQPSSNQVNVPISTPSQNQVINNNTTHNITNNVTNTTNNINNGTINNIHLHINSFGQEKLEHITREFANRCFLMGGYGVQPMLDKIYFDNDCPENHNVKLKSLKNKLVEVFREEQWIPAGMFEIIENMLTKSITQILCSLDKSILQPTEEVLVSMNSIQNMKPNMKKRIHDSTRGKLAARRQELENKK